MSKVKLSIAISLPDILEGRIEPGEPMVARDARATTLKLAPKAPR